MNFITAMLLLVEEKEHNVFWMLCYVVEELLPGYYENDLRGFKIDNAVLDRLLTLHLPKLAKALHEEEGTLQHVSSKWFMTVFLTTLAPESFYVIWDILLLYGSYMLQLVAVSLLRLKEESILESDSVIEWLMLSEQDFKYINIINIVTEAVNLSITKDDIAEHRLQVAADIKKAVQKTQQQKQMRELADLVNMAEGDLSNLEAEFQLISARRKNGFGKKIGIEDFEDVMRRLVPGLKSHAGEFFALFDGDGDGLISFKELMIGFATLTAGTVEDKLTLLFHTFDKNGDGFLEQSEVRNLLHILYKQMGKEPDHAFITRGWNSLDSDQTGRINVEKFRELVQLSPTLCEALALASRKKRKMRRLLSQSALVPAKDGDGVHLLSQKKRKALEDDAAKERERLRQEFIKRSMQNQKLKEKGEAGVIVAPANAKKANRASRRLFRRSVQS